MKNYRRTAALTAGVAAFALALAGCAQSNDSSTDEGAVEEEARTVTIGLIGTFSGANSIFGESQRTALEIAIDQVNAAGGLLDGQIMLDYEFKDDELNPEIGTQAARDFISDGVNHLMGVATAGICLAVAPLVEESEAVFVASGCAPNELTGAFTGEAPFQRTFGMAGRDQMISTALGLTLAEEFPEVTTWDLFGFDYNWGHATWEDFKGTLIEEGVPVTVNGEQWVPLGDTNYASQVSAISRGLTGDVDSSGLFMSTFGGGTLAFFQQAEPFNIVDEVSLVANAGGYDFVGRTLGAAGPEIWNAYDYNWVAFDNANNDAFIKAWEEKTGGERPLAWGYHGYLSALAIIAAIEKAGTEDPNAVRDALAGITFDSPSGSVTVNAKTHQAEAPIVVSNFVGDASEPDGLKTLSYKVVPYADTIR